MSATGVNPAPIDLTTKPRRHRADRGHLDLAAHPHRLFANGRRRVVALDPARDPFAVRSLRDIGTVLQRRGG